MEIDISSVEKLVLHIQESTLPGSMFYIDTSIKKKVPKFLGFPLHFHYVPTVSIKTMNDNYNYESSGEESPDGEEVRCRVRVSSLELGLSIMDELTRVNYPGLETNGTPLNIIKINDLSLENAKKQLEIYRKELETIEEEHKNYRFL